MSAGSGEKKETDIIGFASLECDGCDDGTKADLGCWRFGNKIRGSERTKIDHTGDMSHDKVRFCPRSLLDEENCPPGRVSVDALAQGLARYGRLVGCGGLSQALGEAPVDLPPRVGWFWATANGVERRYRQQIDDKQVQLNNRVAGR